jgi:signal transduction histidine kinase
VAEAQGGSLVLADRPGGGAVFTLSVPLYENFTGG